MIDGINADIGSLIRDKAWVEAMKNKPDSVEVREKIKTAKNFESLFLKQLVNQMKSTVDEEGLFDDPVGGQIRDMFYSFLSDDISDKGGFGMWKEIYNMMDTGNNISSLLDEKI